jgi:uncharacterized repeat protein (TIGR01451 family)
MKKPLPSPSQKQEILLKIAIVFVALVSSLANYGQTVSFNISKMGPAVANPGDVITYTISYANTSAILATDVVITDFLPDPDNYIYMSSVPAGDYDPVSNTITWDKTRIPQLASLGAGTNFISVTIRTGKQGVPPLQSPLGYYTTIPTATLNNQVNIQSGTVSVTSAVVTTLVTTNCTFSLSEPSAGIKSATNSTLTYLVAITNNGNIYQQFDLTSAHVSGIDVLIRYIRTLDGQPLTTTPFLAPGETYFFNYVLVTGTGTKPNEWNETSVTATPTICGSPRTSIFRTFIYGGQYNLYDLVGVYKIDNPDPVQAGGLLNYQIIISNAGDALANYRLTETYPPNTTFISATPPPTSGNNVWNFSSIPAGNTIINVTVQVENDLPNGTFLNNTITGGSFTTVTSTFTEQTTVLSAPDLMVEKTSEIVNPPAEPGSIVNYTITYMNNGNRTATNVVISDNYDEQYVNIVNAGGGNTSAMGEITWTFPTLAPGQGGTLNYTMQIKSEVGLFPAGSTLITNTATILNDLMDSNINDNTDVEIITVLNLPDLKAEKTASLDPAAVGQSLTYNITISNIGDVAHSGPGYSYTVIDHLPAGTVYSSSNPAGTYDAINHSVTWNVTDDLLPAGTKAFTVVLDNLDCNFAGNNISNRVTVYSNNLADADLNNNEFTLVTAVVDNNAPQILGTISATTVEGCSINDVPAAATNVAALEALGVSINDNCTPDGDLVVTYSDVTSGSCPVIVTRTYTVTDASGNSSSVNHIINIDDTSAPTWVTEAGALNLTVECSDAAALAAAQALFPVATDNCDADVTNIVKVSGSFVSGSDCSQAGTITNTWTVTDDCGNTSTVYTQLITIVDTTPPAITTQAANQTVECDGAGNAAALNAWLASNGGAVASDICGNVTWSYSPNPAVISDLCGATGAVTVTFRATDACGLFSETTATFTIVDTTAPTITTQAANQTVECDGAGNAAALSAWLASNGGAVASDICGNVTWSYSPNPAVISDLCGATGAVTVTFRATDACGLFSETTATFTIVDTTVPTITTQAANQTVECDGAGNAAALSAWLASNGGAVASDICGNVTWSYSPNPAVISDLCGATGAVTVTFRATDACGLFSETTATFTIVDTTVPTITTQAANQTVECDGAGNAAALSAWLASNGGAVASDICGNVTWSYSPNPAVISDLCGATGAVTVTFRATDACGLFSETTATFTIVDTTVPTITTQAANQTVECDGAGNAAALSAWLASNGGAVASDICGNVTWSYSPNPAVISDLCGATGAVTVTFRATDACGLFSETTATFTIVDTTAPVITTQAANQTVECDGAGNAAALSAWLASNGGAVASDICGNVTWSYSPNPAVISDLCGATGAVTVTFRATDACGLFSETTATFTIVDTTAPVITTQAANQTVECDGAGNAAALSAWLASNGGAVASDICGNVTWSYSPNPAVISDLCGATGAVTVTFRATDACGLFSETTATFTIVDTTVPTITTQAANQTVECDGAGNAAALNAWLASNGGAVASDICGNVTWSYSPNPAVISDLCGATGAVTVTFRATDACGLFSETTATFTIVDTTAPDHYHPGCKPNRGM